MAARYRTGVIGLGNLGIEIAHALHRAGHDVAAVDLDAARRAEWNERFDAPALDGLDADHAAGLDALFICVRHPGQAHQVLAGLPEVPAPPRPAFVVTTMRTADAVALASLHPPGWRPVEAPVSGGAARAREGSLTVLVAGEVVPGDVDLLASTIASEVVVLDQLGQPTLAKLMNNAIAAYNVAAFEAFAALGEQRGLPADLLHRIVSASSGSSWIVTHLPEVLTDLLAKDLDLAAEELGALPELRLGPGQAPARAWDALARRL